MIEDPAAGARTANSALPSPTVAVSTAVVSVAVFTPVAATAAPATVALTARPETLLPNTSTALTTYFAIVPTAAEEGETSEIAFAAPAVPFM